MKKPVARCALYLSCLFLLGNIPLASAAGADVLEACRDTNFRYAIARDRADTAAFEPLFAEDAVFEISGREFVGRDAILARLREGDDADSFARLLISTLRVTPREDGDFDGIVYFSMYYARGAAESPPPHHTFTLFMGEYHDIYAYADGECRIRERRTVPLFIGDFTP